MFQAEDGIRDVAVTGVQTCALPILASTWKFLKVIYRVPESEVIDKVGCQGLET